MQITFSNPIRVAMTKAVIKTIQTVYLFILIIPSGPLESFKSQIAVKLPAYNDGFMQGKSTIFLCFLLFNLLRK